MSYKTKKWNFCETFLFCPGEAAGLLTQFSKCDFWNLWVFLSRNMWSKIVSWNFFLIEIFFDWKNNFSKNNFSRPKKILWKSQWKMKILKFWFFDEKIEISKFSFFIDFFIGNFVGLEKLFFENICFQSKKISIKKVSTKIFSTTYFYSKNSKDSKNRT